MLQAWEAAHGRRRDLVVGITGPDGFRAHAWLEGDPVPSADAAELDASVLNASPREGWARAPAEGALTPFSELLRRPAPHYRRARSARAP